MENTHGIYTVKKCYRFFPSPAGMSPTKLSLAGNNLVSDIPAGDGKNDNLLYSVLGLIKYMY